LSKSIISYIPKRIFTSKPTEKAATETAVAKAKQLKDAASDVKDRNATDWAIIKQLMKYIWPKNDIGVKTRVVIALSLLIGGKVSIQIETMPIDIDYFHASF
jgi:ABC transporter ATM